MSTEIKKLTQILGVELGNKILSNKKKIFPKG